MIVVVVLLSKSSYPFVRVSIYMIHYRSHSNLKKKEKGINFTYKYLTANWTCYRFLPIRFLFKILMGEKLNLSFYLCQMWLWAWEITTLKHIWVHPLMDHLSIGLLFQHPYLLLVSALTSSQMQNRQVRNIFSFTLPTNIEL